LKILITGSSSGFGRLTAVSLARRGHTVFASMRGAEDRNADAAAELRAWAAAEGMDLTVIDLDVTRQESVAWAIDSITTGIGPLDVVVNNAGAVTVGFTEGFNPAQMRALFEVNVFGAQRVNRAVLPHMRPRRQGLLVHVSSSLARLSFPLMAMYCASKAALEALAEGYRYELAPLGIDSVIVQPGAFPTGIGEKAVTPADAYRAAAYGPARTLEAELEQYFERTLAPDRAPAPELVAQAMVNLIETPQGLRPLRTVVDPQTGELVAAVNAAATRAQTELWAVLGMTPPVCNRATEGSDASTSLPPRHDPG
jgi:NAD(P)-dependent dehydrogenase (short-subunit alcohol dehydrogenase family)